MHYIIGTKIKNTQRTVEGGIKPGMTSAQIRARSTGRSEFGDVKKKFEVNKEYSLARIYPKDGGVLYKFISADYNVVEHIFKSVTQAESFISEIRGESVPDYSSAYRDMTD